jgi:hypothetical protein
MKPALRPAESAGECRQCRAWCDKLVDPGACLSLDCPFLYAFDDEHTDRRYLGCLHKVFKAEVDAGLLEAVRRSGQTFGGLRVARAPLGHCPTSIEPAFGGEGEGYRCVNPRFWDCEADDLDVRDWV